MSYTLLQTSVASLKVNVQEPYFFVARIYKNYTFFGVSLTDFDKAFLFVTFSFLTNFAPKNLITSKNVSMNKRLKSVLLVLLSMVSGMAFGDSTLDDEIEIVLGGHTALIVDDIDDIVTQTGEHITLCARIINSIE